MAESLQAIEEVLRSERNWMLCLIGDDQFSQLGRLMNDLRSAPSATGDGKKIDSGFSYWGIGPTRAWERACTDLAYLVMKESISSFPTRWDRVKTELLLSSRFHYVSLGVGTGQKDRHLLGDLAILGPGQSYFAIDMSAEMLRYSVNTSLGALRRGKYSVYAIQIDFSSSRNLDELKEWIHRCVGDAPILYSLLGNTLANFIDDVQVLKSLVRLLRPQDRLLLELAYTSVANESSAERAAEEYRRSELFKQFATSALLHNTDLPIDVDRVEIAPQIEAEGRAIALKVIYKGKHDGEEFFSLPDRFKVRFPANDTIRIYFTRKYTRLGIENLFRKVGCYAHEQDYYQIDNAFGIALFVLGPQSGAVFVSFASDDRPFVERLRKELLINGIDPWIDFDDSDMGSKLLEGIKNAIRNADKLLLIFSAASKDREWVKAELRLAFKEFNQEQRRKLYVVSLTPLAELQCWQCFDDLGQNLAQKILEYPVPNFSDWTDLTEVVFAQRVEQLARGLRG